MEINMAKQTDLIEILELQYLAYKSEAEIYNDFKISPLTQTLNDIEQEYKNQNIKTKALEQS